MYRLYRDLVSSKSQTLPHEKFHNSKTKNRIINLKTVLKSGEYFPKAQKLKGPIFTGIFFSVATLPIEEKYFQKFTSPTSRQFSDDLAK